MKRDIDTRKRIARALCALMLVLFVESSLCTALHLPHGHLAECEAGDGDHDHCTSGDTVPPCDGGCDFEIHGHNELLTPTTEDSTWKATVCIVPTEIVLPNLQVLSVDDMSSDIEFVSSAHTILQTRTTVLLV